MENNIQYKEQDFTLMPLFVRDGKLYTFDPKGILISFPHTSKYFVNGWINIRLFWNTIQVRDRYLIEVVLEDLQDGDSISKMIAIFQQKKSLEWIPRKMKEIPLKNQRAMIYEKLVERDGNWYGFNYMGEFTCLGKSESESKEVKVDEKTVWRVFSNLKISYEKMEEALKKLKPGDDIQTLNDYIVETRNKWHRYTADSLERFITKIDRPYFERATGNTQEGTFDFIRIEVGIITEWHEDRIGYIRKHKDEITKRVLAKIEKSKTFKKMGVPINFLKLSSITLRIDSVLEYLFELKLM